jgi:hypothetical protein
MTSKKKRQITLTGIAIVLMSTSLSFATHDTIIITVRADRPGTMISPTLWGILIEGINFTFGGGLYAELVKNRSFGFSDPMMGWEKNTLAIASQDRYKSRTAIRISFF